METFVSSGRIVDAILAFVVFEAVLLLIYRARTGRGLRPSGILLMLLPGVCLLLSLRAALTDGPYTAVLVWLTAALIAHAADLCHRRFS